MSDLHGVAGSTCTRWPDKKMYLTADEASIALREVWASRASQGLVFDYDLVPYVCRWGTRLHWHLGHLSFRTLQTDRHHPAALQAEAQP